MGDFISRSVGRCLTEYKHKDFRSLVERAESFYTISQFSPDPKSIKDVNANYVSTNWKCSYGQKCFAIVDDKLIKIISILDSSG